MPPRKSDVAKATSEEVGVGAPSASTPAKEAAHKEKDGVNIEDLNLPKSIVTRLAKGVLPPSTQIQGNAMLAMTKSATVFVGYLAAHANEYAQAANRKTVTPADVLRALEDLEFGEFRPRGKEEGEGGPKAKKPRLEEGAGEGGEDHEEETVLEDHEEGEEEHEGDDEPDDEVEDDGEEEEQDEDHHDDDGEDRVENGRDEDEALDNGEDSD
ncbi:hypothetical protein VC83_01153 [Pseudogymnoascus destructans]|uniref:DNA polymerase epsilon subunit D n=1 Tax=Pseudogymnoascus destructans TaxID=655981 RepID=A0A177AJV8_9PEZI|nr:uncharacterized protein VC83_01153 [Pseudogymnoascus destructans]OAF62367.1 hypothetical protein VC83_01153 [Pseudogymnoascus destructans]